MLQLVWIWNPLGHVKVEDRVFCEQLARRKVSEMEGKAFGYLLMYTNESGRYGQTIFSP